MAKIPLYESQVKMSKESPGVKYDASPEISALRDIADIQNKGVNDLARGFQKLSEDYAKLNDETDIIQGQSNLTDFSIETMNMQNRYLADDWSDEERTTTLKEFPTFDDWKTKNQETFISNISGSPSVIRYLQKEAYSQFNAARVDEAKRSLQFKVTDNVKTRLNVLNKDLRIPTITNKETGENIGGYDYAIAQAEKLVTQGLLTNEAFENWRDAGTVELFKNKTAYMHSLEEFNNFVGKSIINLETGEDVFYKDYLGQELTNDEKRLKGLEVAYDELDETDPTRNQVLDAITTTRNKIDATKNSIKQINFYESLPTYLQAQIQNNAYESIQKNTTADLKEVEKYWSNAVDKLSVNRSALENARLPKYILDGLLSRYDAKVNTLIEGQDVFVEGRQTPLQGYDYYKDEILKGEALFFDERSRRDADALQKMSKKIIQLLETGRPERFQNAISDLVAMEGMHPAVRNKFLSMLVGKLETETGFNTFIKGEKNQGIVANIDEQWAWSRFIENYKMANRYVDPNAQYTDILSKITEFDDWLKVQKSEIQEFNITDENLDKVNNWILDNFEDSFSVQAKQYLSGAGVYMSYNEQNNYEMQVEEQEILALQKELGILDINENDTDTDTVDSDDTDNQNENQYEVMSEEEKGEKIEKKYQEEKVELDKEYEESSFEIDGVKFENNRTGSADHQIAEYRIPTYIVDEQLKKINVFNVTDVTQNNVVNRRDTVVLKQNAPTETPSQIPKGALIYLDTRDGYDVIVPWPGSEKEFRKKYFNKYGKLALSESILKAGYGISYEVYRKRVKPIEEN